MANTGIAFLDLRRRDVGDDWVLIFLTLFTFTISYYNSIWKLLMFLHFNLYIYKSKYEDKTGFYFSLVLRGQRLVKAFLGDNSIVNLFSFSKFPYFLLLHIID